MCPYFPPIALVTTQTIRKHTRGSLLRQYPPIFAGHHQPLKVWVLCLYFMGLNLSNEQIAKELDVNLSDVQQMTTQLREGIVKKSPP
jgi:hypothetical protein